eukprot:4417068-Ditylum_brightwellii.AAC.1
MGCTDCDANACYDRILPVVLLLIFFKAGLPYAMCTFFAQLLYTMCYHMTTVFGISRQVNYFGLLATVLGIRQGSTDRPPGWALISDIILKVYHRMCHRYNIADPDRQVTIQQNTDMFVNNATLLHNSQRLNTSSQQLMQQIQHDAETWGQLL